MPEDAKTKFLQMVGPSESSSDEPDATDAIPDEGMHTAAEAALHAIKSGDSRAFLSAVQSIFEMMEARPHPEAASEEAA